MQCNCGVSIVYLTPQLFSEPEDQTVEDNLIEQGNVLARQADRLGESHIMEMYQRAIFGRAPPELQ